MVTAIFGLLGVALGAILTVFKEWWFQRRKDQKDAEYLCIQVSCALERYVAHCADIVEDDGLYRGQADENGYSSPQISTPTFDPTLFKGEWRALPAELMYEILDFPYELEVANRTVESAFDNAVPPDFDFGFDERQIQFANLGLAASILAEKLRNHVGLPSRPESKWNPVGRIKARKADIELRRRTA